MQNSSSELGLLREEFDQKLVLESTYAGKKVEIYTSKAIDVKDRLESALLTCDNFNQVCHTVAN